MKKKIKKIKKMKKEKLGETLLSEVQSETETKKHRNIEIKKDTNREKIKE